MSVDCVNALNKVDYTLFMTICPRFVCLSRVSLVADMLRCRGFDLLLELGHRAGGAEKRHLERRRQLYNYLPVVQRIPTPPARSRL